VPVVRIPDVAAKMSNSRAVAMTQLSFCMAVLASALLAQSQTQQIPSGHNPALSMEIHTDSAVGKHWKVVNAQLREGLTASSGVLRIENISTQSIRKARFYAEYYDRDERLCFTLVFAAEENDEDDNTPFGPGYTRNLLSAAVELSPATRAVGVRLSLISQETEGSPAGGGTGEGIIRSPVIIAGGLSPASLAISHSAFDARSPVADLLLAQVEVDEQGKPVRVTRLNDGSRGVREWFDRVLKHPGFNPASIGFRNISGTGLVLVIAVRDPARAQYSLARDSAWVKTYIQQFRGSELPPVAQLIFFPSTQTGLSDSGNQHPRPPAEESMFELISVGDGWSSNVIGWKFDRRSGRLLRTWRSDDEAPQ
jgi:hypothetical protein